MKTIKLSRFTVLLFLLNACTNSGGHEKLLKEKKDFQQAYQELLKKESAKKDQVDSIFYGVSLKMSASDFYDHCNKMYKKGIFDGGYDMQVVVMLDKLFKRPVKLMFYPSFDKPFISKLKSHFSYKYANIFDKADRSGVLMKELIPLLMSWYGGNEFIEMPSDNPLKGPGYIKIDANRKLSVTESDNGTDVEAIYEDLKPLH